MGKNLDLSLQSCINKPTSSVTYSLWHSESIQEDDVELLFWNLQIISFAQNQRGGTVNEKCSKSYCKKIITDISLRRNKTWKFLNFSYSRLNCL